VVSLLVFFVQGFLEFRGDCFTGGTFPRDGKRFLRENDDDDGAETERLEEKMMATMCHHPFQTIKTTTRTLMLEATTTPSSTSR